MLVITHAPGLHEAPCPLRHKNSEFSTASHHYRRAASSIPCCGQGGAPCWAHMSECMSPRTPPLRGCRRAVLHGEHSALPCAVDLRLKRLERAQNVIVVQRGPDERPPRGDRLERRLRGGCEGNPPKGGRLLLERLEGARRAVVVQRGADQRPLLQGERLERGLSGGHHRGGSPPKRSRLSTLLQLLKPCQKIAWCSQNVVGRPL